MTEHERWAKLFGGFIVRALQGDTRDFLEFARQAKIDYINCEPHLHITAAAPRRSNMIDCLENIANMQITEHTDTAEALALCISIARLELEKLKS